MSLALDIAGNRLDRKYTRSEQVQRVLWAAVHPIFRFSPRLLPGWRRLLLRLFGAQIGRQVLIDPRTSIFLPSLLVVGDESAIGPDVRLYNLGALTIGEQVTISHGAHICGGSHDHRDPRLPLIRAPITIHRCAWICADAFVGPGVSIGEGAVVGARAVAVKDVPAWQVVGGNPARAICNRELPNGSR